MGEKEKLEEIKQILQDACDRDWEDESLYATASIAANGLYWRGKEIERLKAELNIAKDGLAVSADIIRQYQAPRAEVDAQDAARYRKLRSLAVEGDWGNHSGWRLQVDIPGAPSLDNIDDAIDAFLSLPSMNRERTEPQPSRKEE